MKVISEKNVLTLRKIQKGKDHEGVEFIVSADIILNGKQIGFYAEDYMCGPCMVEILNSEDIVQSIAEKFFQKYPKGIIPSRYDFSLEELYKGKEIEGLITEIASIQAHIEPNIKKILKKTPIAVIAKKGERGIEKMWSVPSEDDMKTFDDMIVLLKAESGKKNFDFTV